MPEIKRIIFDLDNTLIPWKDEYNDAGRQALDDCKIAIDYHEIDTLIQTYEQKFLSFKIETMAKYFNELYHRTNGYEFVTLWLKYLGKMSNKNPKLIETLEYLYPKYELIVLTNWFKESQLNRLKNAKIDRYFKEVIGGDEFIKPNIESFKLAMGSYKPEECIMIGDSLPIDIIGARNAGLNVIYLTQSEEIYEFPTIKEIYELKRIL